MLQKIYENSKQNYECIKCDYVCYTKALITQHIATRKHQNANNATLNICICGKMFKHHSSFSRHRKTCNLINLKDTSNNLIFDVIKQNQEFKDLITEQNKQIIEQNKQLIELVKDKNIIINNSTITNKFNLNLFLNEKCKDALNIADFINSLQVQLIDLENIGKFGYVDGISKIFIRSLKELDLYKRPIHCSDLKREVLYIKDKNLWKKDEEKENLINVIKQIESKNIKKIPEWREKNPLANDSDTQKHLEYQYIINQSMGGANLNEDLQNYNKIIKNIAKQIIIDK